MKNYFIYVFTAVFFMLTAFSCSRYEVPEVVEEEVTIPFEELVLLLNVKASDSTYLVVQSIDSVKLYINTTYWAKVSSQPVDVSKITKTDVGNKSVSKNKVNYLVLAEQESEQPALTTAGDYAQYLNDQLSLMPGEYACFIESFQVTFNDQSTLTVYPQVYKIFKVEKDARSASVGEIELNLN